MATNQPDRGRIVTKDIDLVPREGAAKRAIATARKLIRLISALEIFNWPLIIAGIALSLYLVYQRPSTIAYISLILYVLLWSTKLLRFTQKPRYGVVRDENGMPLSNAVIQLTSMAEGVESHVLSTVADDYGRFVLLAKPGVYSMIVTKEGFTPLTQTVEADDVNVEVTLIGAAFSSATTNVA